VPELPEVETLRRDLDREVVGRKIKTVEVSGNRAIRRHRNKRQFISRLEGQKLTTVRRRGKYLVFEVGDEDLLVVHLGMSGQLLKLGTKEPKIPHTHVVITFTQGGQLRFVDPRTFGEMFVTPKETFASDVPEIGELGFDALDDVMSWTDFGELLRGRKGKLKALLMDQKIIAGLGNIYSDEILFTAGLRHERSADSLSTQEVRRLYRALSETLQDALKHRGSTLGDEQYRDLFGEPGEYQNEHKVYGQEGEACRRCRSPVKRAKWQGRSTFFCEQCQV